MSIWLPWISNTPTILIKTGMEFINIHAPHTCKFESSVATDYTDFRLWIGRLAVVSSNIRLIVLIMYDAQKEQLPTRQKDVIGRRVHGWRLNELSITIPCDLRGWFSCRHTVQRLRLLFRDILVFRVLNDAWVCYLLDAWRGNKKYVHSTIPYVQNSKRYLLYSSWSHLKICKKKKLWQNSN